MPHFVPCFVPTHVLVSHIAPIVSEYLFWGTIASSCDIDDPYGVGLEPAGGFLHDFSDY